MFQLLFYKFAIFLMLLWKCIRTGSQKMPEYTSVFLWPFTTLISLTWPSTKKVNKTLILYYIVVERGDPDILEHRTKCFAAFRPSSGSDVKFLRNKICISYIRGWWLTYSTYSTLDSIYTACPFSKNYRSYPFTRKVYYTLD